MIDEIVELQPTREIFKISYDEVLHIPAAVPKGLAIFFFLLRSGSFILFLFFSVVRSKIGSQNCSSENEHLRSSGYILMGAFNYIQLVKEKWIYNQILSD